MRLALQPSGGNESNSAQTASLFRGCGVGAARTQNPAPPESDEATHIDEVVEKLEPELSSSEIFAALLELVTGKVRQLPGKNFVKSF